MRISLIGAGRVATHLALVLKNHHPLVNIYSRHLEKAELLAQLVDAQACAEITQMHSEIDLLIIAVSDQAIASVIEEVAAHFSQVLIVHTSGSTHLNVLTAHHQRAGVFYPLQTFSLERSVDWLNTPLLIEATNPADGHLLMQLAQQLSQRVYLYSSAQRLSLHLAAVFACNFSNYCYDMAKQLVDVQDVDFSLLYPLMLETAQKATQFAPQQMQTGPAMRGDQNILNMHQAMLDSAHRDDLKQVYQLMSEQILARQQALS